MKPTLNSLIISAALCLHLHATARTSADYTIPADTVDSGGCRTTSALYTNDGSAALVAGISTTPDQTVMKSGYVAQLTDVTGITLSAPQSTVVEGTTIQIEAFEVLDDNSLALVAPQSVTWSVLSGPLASVSTSGLATAATVYQDTAATMHASHLSFQASFALTVLNTGTDDYGSYAADGLPDAWQVQYFGANNPNAGPNVDADGTGQNNRFKWIAGLNPIDGSRFLTTVLPLPGQPSKMRLSFSPVVAGRTYTVEYNDAPLSGAWHALTGFSQADNGITRTVTDNTATGTHRFYRVAIGMP